MGLMEPLVWACMHTCQTAMLVHVCTVFVYWEENLSKAVWILHKPREQATRPSKLSVNLMSGRFEVTVHGSSKNIIECG